jgi:glutathione synthase
MTNKRVAIQMDAPQGLKPFTDTTILLGLEAQRRGYTLVHYHPSSLSVRSGKVYAKTQPIIMREGLENWYDLGEWQHTDLGEMDVILMRQDPPFDMGYITATHFLEMLMPKVFVTNHPAHVRDCPEKIFPLMFHEFMPETLITSSRDDVLAFLAEFKDIVIKPLFGYAGLGVFRLKQGGDNIQAILETLLTNPKEPYMVQRFLPEVKDGDRRILLIDGKVEGVLGRIPAQGEIRANFRAGGSAASALLTPRQREICDAIAPELVKRDLILVGLDVIGDYLTEINLTSPTGMPAIKRLYNSTPESLVWDAIERRLS